MDPITLVTLPFAGAMVAPYSRWSALLPPWVTLAQFELGGRGRRFGEPFPDSVRAVAAEALAFVLRTVGPRPFALFGHSMGALIAYEVCLALQERGLALPRHVFLSAERAPHAPRGLRPLSRLPDPELVEELRRFGGIPEEVLRFQPMLDLVLPVVRADLALVDTYAPPAGLGPLAAGVTLLRGTLDDISPEEMREWERVARAPGLHDFRGGHFFLFEREAERDVTALVARTLSASPADARA